MAGSPTGKGPKFGVVVFPGSNCDHDTYHVLKHVLGVETIWLWHKEADLRGCDVVVLPGGFAHGDYLRCGAIARFSPIMAKVMEHAGDGGYVMGICNGFQVLLEAGLLPGALIRNKDLRFLSMNVHLRVETTETAFTNTLQKDAVLRMPIAHGGGNYFADPETLRKIEENGQVVFRYCEPSGKVSDAANVNGSAGAIAGLTNEAGNVLGVMPHPERASEAVLGCEDGRAIFESLAARAASRIQLAAGRAE